MRNRFVFSGKLEVPIGNRLQNNRVSRVILGDWQINTIATFQSGTPFTLYSNAGSSGQGNALERVDITGPVRTFNARKIESFDSTCGGGTNANYYFGSVVVRLQPGVRHRTFYRDPLLRSGIWDEMRSTAPA